MGRFWGVWGLLCAAGLFGGRAVACDANVSIVNIYGQPGSFWLFLNQGTTNVFNLQFDLSPSDRPDGSGRTTIPLPCDQLVDGTAYTLRLATRFGGFSNYRMSLCGMEFFDGTTEKSGFIPDNLHDAVFTVNLAGACGPTFFDPMPDLLDIAHNFGMTTDPQRLGTQGRQVYGVSADGVTRVIVRIPVPNQTDAVTVRMLNEQKQPSITTDDEGGLDVAPGDNPAPSMDAPLAVSEVPSGSGRWWAFAVYRAPVDFVRSWQQTGCTNCDKTANTRTVYIEVSVNGSVVYTPPVAIVRPPVVLVHGFLANSDAWNTFTPFINDPRIQIFRADYGKKAVTGIISIEPNYSVIVGNTSSSALSRRPVVGSQLGFDYNTDTVMDAFDSALESYRSSPKNFRKPVAAVQVDVVAHSMGGLITRNAQHKGALFYKFENYFAGAVHKLITIGTPHLGSPNGFQIVQPQNFCLGNLLATVKGYFQLKFVFFANTFANGAPFDLAGDRTQSDAGLSAALKELKRPAYKPLRVAMLAGQATSVQYAAMQLSIVAQAARTLCGTRNLVGPPDPDNIADNYTAQGWRELMGGDSDGVVPLNSGLNGNPSTAGNTFPAVHSPGVVSEGFAPPHLQLQDSAVPQAALALLNVCVLNSPYSTVP